MSLVDPPVVAPLDVRPLPPRQVEPAPVPFVYRAPSSLAVACFALGLLSGLTFLAWWLATLPAAALGLGVLATRQIRRRSDELTGMRLVGVGMTAAAVFWAGGWGWLGYEYATEVPEGYRRITYDLLQPDPATPNVLPAGLAELNGQQVFIKGYMYPPPYPAGIRRFLLVRDSGSCCFGGNPKITDRIQVQVAAPEGVEYNTGVIKLAGVFRVAEQAQVHGVGDNVPGGILYHLDEALAR